MRDFRDAKAMARSIRAELAAKDIKITVGESLELIAKAFGLADWNRLAAAIQSPPLQAASSPLPSPGKTRLPVGPFGSTLVRAGKIADARQHEYTTLEHLLLALADDPEAAEVMVACGVDLPALKASLSVYLDTELSTLRRVEPRAELTASARRLLDRAAISGEPEFGMPPGLGWVSSVNALLAILSESDSYASYYLREQGMSSQAAAEFQQHEPTSPGLFTDEQTDPTTGENERSPYLGAGLREGLTPQEREALPLSDLPASAARTTLNAPCPCGSGKRFKDCHGKLIIGTHRAAD